MTIYERPSMKELDLSKIVEADEVGDGKPILILNPCIDYSMESIILGDGVIQ